MPAGQDQALPFCRDCLRVSAQTMPSARCTQCGSPRVLVHPERDTLAIAHIDCDAFYATVEKRDNPALADRPVIVGGGRRGVVSTCCYIARTYGVRSAMPMFKALALCPDAVVVRPDMAKYAEAGRAVRARMLALTPLVEPLSIDEAFLDLSGTARVHGSSAALTLARFAAAVEAELGITVSVGLSYCKFLAKVASEIDKPRGFAMIGRAEAVTFLASRPVDAIWGVGKVMRDRFARDGITTIGDLQALDVAALMQRYGSEGQRYWRLARGIDARRVSPERETKSISAETTFDIDLSDMKALAPIVLALSEKVARRLKKADLAGRTLTLKLKATDFRLRTRSISGFPPTQLSARIYGLARDLLGRELDGTRYRLIGVGVSEFVPGADADRADLIDTSITKEKATDRAIDAVRDRFGNDAIVRGIALGPAARKLPT